MKDCIFCKIINGEMPSYKLYEDDTFIAFLDINPDSSGHTLIIPKKHILDATEMDDDTFKDMNKVIKLMYDKLSEKLEFDGLTLIQNNGIRQIVKHYHMHLIPVYKNNKKIPLEEVFNLLK